MPFFIHWPTIFAGVVIGIIAAWTDIKSRDVPWGGILGLAFFFIYGIAWSASIVKDQGAGWYLIIGPMTMASALAPFAVSYAVANGLARLWRNRP